MKRKARKFMWIAALFAAAQVGAQSSTPLVGAWERVSMSNAQGPVTAKVGAYIVFSASGHFSQTVAPVDRPKLNKPLGEMTREELLARFQGLGSRFGTYRISGNKLVRKNITHVNPADEEEEETWQYRIEGDVMILNPLEGKGEIRFRRLKPAA